MFATSHPPLSIPSHCLRPDVQVLQPRLSLWRRRLHQEPELGFREQVTARLITDELTAWGVPHQAGIAETGVVATITGERPGPVLAIRADMDALPIQEENEVSYRSRRDGRMHACGHDGHVAIALGTAYYLAHHRQELAGTVKIIFQPAEEGPGGAQPMIEAGVLTNPPVEAIIGLHLWNNLPLGTVGVRPGALMAAVETFACEVLGQGGHGAMPHQTVDSVLVGADIVRALQSIVSRNLDPLKAGVVTVGEFHSGTALNIIADTAFLRGTVRYFDPSLHNFFQPRLEQTIAGVCAAHGAKFVLDYQRVYPPLVNDPWITDLVHSVATEVLEVPARLTSDCQTMGGEDMAFFLEAVPGCYFFLGAANPDQGLAYPHHHPRFDFDERALGLGVEMFLRCLAKLAEVRP